MLTHKQCLNFAPKNSRFYMHLFIGNIVEPSKAVFLSRSTYARARKLSIHNIMLPHWRFVELSDDKSPIVRRCVASFCGECDKEVLLNLSNDRDDSVKEEANYTLSRISLRNKLC